MSRAERRRAARQDRLKVRPGEFEAALRELSALGIVEVERRDGEARARIDLRGTVQALCRLFERDPACQVAGSGGSALLAEARALLDGVWTPEAEDRALALVALMVAL